MFCAEQWTHELPKGCSEFIWIEEKPEVKPEVLLGQDKWWEIKIEDGKDKGSVAGISVTEQTTEGEKRGGHRGNKEEIMRVS